MSFAKEHYELSAALLVGSVFLVPSLLCLRRWRLESIRADEAMHALCHDCRDHMVQLMACTTVPVFRTEFRAFLTAFVNNVAAHYQARFSSQGIECALRVAQRDQMGVETYATMARSRGMNSARDDSSKPIPTGQGLADAMMKANRHGVLIIPTIQTAKDDRVWLDSDNDKLPDVQCLMVAPVNGYSAGQKALLGLLYVTSDRPGDVRLCPATTVALKGFADLMGLLLTILSPKITQVMQPAAVSPSAGATQGSQP